MGVAAAGSGGAAASASPARKQSLARSQSFQDHKVSTLGTSATVMRAVVKMQALVRTRRARQEYGRMLFDKYAAEEAEQEAAHQRELEQGMAFLEQVEAQHSQLDKQLVEHQLRRQRSLNSILDSAAKPAGE